MNEAFGPHTSTHITEPKETGYGWIWWAAMVAVSVCGLITIVLGAPA